MYYLIKVQNDSIPAIAAYDTLEAVNAEFHTEMAYRHESRYSTKCMILDADLVVVRTEVYTKPVDTTPTEEPTEGEQ